MEKEIKKEIQFYAEKEKLEETVEIINKEISDYISKRKEIIKYITDFREKNIEEYRDDEDRLVEYFDHERFVKEEAFKTIDRRLKELTVLHDIPYFGKITFNDKEFDDEEIIYIGRFGLTPAGSFEPVVVDWRSPVSSLFYAGKLGDAHYNAPMGSIPVDITSKRQFIIKKSILKGLFDTEKDVKDEILQMVLSGNSGEKLKDIIMTIQEEQDNIIRQPKDVTVVVDGTAGSGKTTIALHRVAYLLYNYRDTLQDKILVFGPNSIFMEYISTVLPSLGEVGVMQTTFADFALDILKLHTVVDLKEYMEKIILNDKKFISEIIYKNSKEYIVKLNEIIENTNKNYFNIKDVKFDNTIICDSLKIKMMMGEKYIDLPLFRRSKKVKRIIFEYIKEERNERVKEVQIKFKEEMEKLNKDESESDSNELDFKRRLKIREVLKKAIKSKNSVNMWINNPNIVDIYVNNVGIQSENLTYDDLAPILYLKIKLEGYKLKGEIKHVVIDEAQDFSYLQFDVIKELTRCQSMTVVGDTNQRIIPTDSEVSMVKLSDILSEKKVQTFDLFKSYRSTKEIISYANKYLTNKKQNPLVRNGEEVKEEKIYNDCELKDKIMITLKSLKEKGYESVGIICRTIEETRYIGRLLKDKIYINVMDNEDILYKGGEVVIPSYYAKGMEFDAVIIIDTKENDHYEEDKLMYIMATRALHELYVYKYKIHPVQLL